MVVMAVVIFVMIIVICMAVPTNITAEYCLRLILIDN